MRKKSTAKPEALQGRSRGADASEKGADMIYRVKIGQGAQPYTSCDDLALWKLGQMHGLRGRQPHDYYGNGGIRRLGLEMDVDAFRADLHAQGVRTRKLKAAIKVIPPVEVIEAATQLQAVWMRMIEAGRTDWDKMRAELYDAAERYKLSHLID